jgi:hypothetical protein
MWYWIFFIVMNVLSLVFYFVVLVRVRDYTSQFLRHETAYIRLFHLISLRHVFAGYFISLILMIIAEVFYTSFFW